MKLIAVMRHPARRASVPRLLPALYPLCRRHRVDPSRARRALGGAGRADPVRRRVDRRRSRPAVGSPLRGGVVNVGVVTGEFRHRDRRSHPRRRCRSRPLLHPPLPQKRRLLFLRLRRLSVCGRLQ